MKNIVITGCAGYIGGTFLYEALKKGFNVLGMDNFSNSKPETIELIKEKYNSFKFIELDISSDREVLENALNEFDYECIIHFAALKSVSDSETNPHLYWKNNVDATLNLLELTKSDTSFIFSSSATIYGDAKIQPIDENAIIQTASTYGSTKVASELLLDDFCRSKKIRGISLRYFNPVGAHADKCIVEDFKNKPSNLMPRLIAAVKNKTNKIDVYGNDYNTCDGTGERDYIHISDLVQGHFCAIEKAKKINGHKKYNLGTGKQTSVIQLIEAFNKVNSTNIKYQIKPRRNGDVAVSYADPSLANTELSWKTNFDIYDMCKDAWESSKDLD